MKTTHRSVCSQESYRNLITFISWIMRLLHAEKLVLTEFHDYARPRYAILSHTWGEEEVSFQLIHDLEAARSAEGFAKVAACARQALRDGFEWIWVDTCCIDKSSSAELSEAINSMFDWYRNAVVCYVYLADVVLADAEIYSFYGQSDGLEKSALGQKFSTSRWLTRGWTLQELLAPTKIEFYSADWSLVGTRACLQGIVSHVTLIPPSILSDHQGQIRAWLRSCSIAERMRWAARRHTTRTEDIAYSLMGIFDVNMPLLYGEGDKAFERLQQEILRKEEDLSIFAWCNTKGLNSWGMQNRAFSPHPSRFLCTEVLDFNPALPSAPSRTSALKDLQLPTPILDTSKPWQQYPPLSITGRGILLTLLVIPRQEGEKSKGLVAWTYSTGRIPSLRRNLLHVCFRNETPEGFDLGTLEKEPPVLLPLRDSIVCVGSTHLDKFQPARIYLALDEHTTGKISTPYEIAPVLMPMKIRLQDDENHSASAVPRRVPFTQLRSGIFIDHMGQSMYGKGSSTVGFDKEKELAVNVDCHLSRDKISSVVFLKWLRHANNMGGLDFRIGVSTSDPARPVSERTSSKVFQDRGVAKLFSGHYVTVDVKLGSGNGNNAILCFGRITKV